MSATDDIPTVPPFTGMTLDRASVQRKDREWVRAAAAAPDAVLVGASADGVLVAADASRLARVPAAIAPAPPAGSEIVLGLEDGRPVLALDLEGENGTSALPDGTTVMSLRDAGSQLPTPEAGLAAYAAAMLNWHRRHGFCANCGAASELREGGYVRGCPRCGAQHFPRTDPVVIMSVEHDDRLLLGGRAGGIPGRVSVLAGFVSPGESAEEAVVREIHEESGITARDPVFVSSQPWPFPASLMLGFHAVSDGGDPVPTDGELDTVAWVARDEVRASARGEGAFQLPPPVSIARLLIDRWLAAGD